jgi:hypothetical protein
MAESLWREHFCGSSQRVDTSSAGAAATTVHYEYQYGYDKHGDSRVIGS